MKNTSLLAAVVVSLIVAGAAAAQPVMRNGTWTIQEGQIDSNR